MRMTVQACQYTILEGTLWGLSVIFCLWVDQELQTEVQRLIPGLVSSQHGVSQDTGCSTEASALDCSADAVEQLKALQASLTEAYDVNSRLTAQNAVAVAQAEARCSEAQEVTNDLHDLQRMLADSQVRRSSWLLLLKLSMMVRDDHLFLQSTGRYCQLVLVMARCPKLLPASQIELHITGRGTSSVSSSPVCTT